MEKKRIATLIVIPILAVALITCILVNVPQSGKTAEAFDSNELRNIKYLENKTIEHLESLEKDFRIFTGDIDIQLNEYIKVYKYVNCEKKWDKALEKLVKPFVESIIEYDVKEIYIHRVSDDAVFRLIAVFKNIEGYNVKLIYATCL